MTRNMNNEEINISKIDIISGLLIFAGISIVSLNIAIIFFMGVMVSLLNYLFSTVIIKKYIFKRAGLIVISSIVRIILVSAITIPFINDVKLILAYLIGFILHYINMICCTIYRKGSA